MRLLRCKPIRRRSGPPLRSGGTMRTLLIAASAAILLLLAGVSPGQAGTSDCAELSDRDERWQCQRESVADLIERMQPYVCARRMVEATFLSVGAKMGMTPSQMATSIARDPESMKARMREVMIDASRLFGETLAFLIELEDESEKRAHIKFCVETLGPSPFDEGTE